MLLHVLIFTQSKFTEVKKKVKFSEYEATAAKITASMEAKNKTRRKTSVFTVYV